MRREWLGERERERRVKFSPRPRLGAVPPPHHNNAKSAQENKRGFCYIDITEAHNSTATLILERATLGVRWCRMRCLWMCGWRRGKGAGGLEGGGCVGEGTTSCGDIRAD